MHGSDCFRSSFSMSQARYSILEFGISLALQIHPSLQNDNPPINQLSVNLIVRMSDIYGSDLIPGDVMALGTHEGIWSYMTPWGSNIHDTIYNLIQSFNQDLNDTDTLNSNTVSSTNDEFDIWKKKNSHGGGNSTVSYNCVDFIS
ncbi:unnamed protein product [[Candida] boidinii]|nr:unnamed protein product [[Candida] boidinii]